MLPQY